MRQPVLWLAACVLAVGCYSTTVDQPAPESTTALPAAKQEEAQTERVQPEVRYYMIADT